MCLAVPAKIVAIREQQAQCVVNDLELVVRLDLVEEAAVGDYVLVHAGYAITRLETAEALETLALLEEVAGRDAPGSLA